MLCTRNTFRHLLAGSLAVSFIGGLANAADPGAPCGQYEVYIKYVEVKFIDHPPEGTNLGDSRVGQIALITPDEQVVGQLYFHSVVIPGGGDDQHNLLLNSRFVFPEGSFPWSVIYQRPNLTDTVPGPSIVQGGVAGGTGSFADTTGTVTLDYDQDKKRVIKFDLSCPGD